MPRIIRDFCPGARKIWGINKTAERIIKTARQGRHPSGPSEVIGRDPLLRSRLRQSRNQSLRRIGDLAKVRRGDDVGRAGIIKVFFGNRT